MALRIRELCGFGFLWCIGTSVCGVMGRGDAWMMTYVENDGWMGRKYEADYVGVDTCFCESWFSYGLH